MMAKKLNMVWLKVSLVSFVAVFCVLLAPVPADALTVSTGQDVTVAYYEVDDETDITIERGGRLIICTGYSEPGVDHTAYVSADVTFSSAGSGNVPTIRVEPCMGSPISGGLPTQGVKFSGTITLQTNACISVYQNKLGGNYTLVRNGFGICGNLAGGTASPGASPGILSLNDLLFDEDSFYEFELGGTTVGTEYDQIDVTGTVTLGNAGLHTSLYGGFTPTVGQTFTIISNDSNDAVVGTFAGLVQGATFNVSNYSFTISYVGGDGNDVVLTSVPYVPDAGIELSGSNPALVISLTTVAALAIALAARRVGHARR